MPTFRFDDRARTGDGSRDPSPVPATVVHYRERGTGAPLIVLPGSTASSAHHEGELAHFARDWHAIAFDPPGTGLSERLERWPDDWWTLSARAVLALVEHLGGAPAVLVGTSGGSVTALTAAALDPSRVRAVVADSVVPRYDPDFLRRASIVRRLQTDAMVAFWRTGHGDDWEQVVAADGDFLERFGARGGDPFEGRLAGVRCPVLVTGSIGDDLVAGIGEGALEFAAALAKSEVFLTRDGGHPMMWTRAREFRDAADAFLRRVLS